MTGASMRNPAPMALTAIRIDGGTQARAGLDDDVVADYAAMIRDGADFPPVIVFFDGKHRWLADGFHRFHAYRHAGAIEIAADVRQGTKRDAVLFSVGANVDHGLRRTNADKRSAVMVLLKDAEWSKWSDREIARRAGVTHPFVAGLRPKVVTVTTPTVTAVEGKSQAIRVEKAIPPAEHRSEETEFDRQREEAQAGLPDEIKEMQAARQRAIEARQVGDEQPALYNGLTAEERIAELEEHIRVVDAENAELKASNARYADMAVLFEKGGFEAVIAAKDEEIRVLQTRLYQESADKASWARNAKFWKKKAIALGYSSSVYIPLDGSEASTGEGPPDEPVGDDTIYIDIDEPTSGATIG